MAFVMNPKHHSSKCLFQGLADQSDQSDQSHQSYQSRINESMQIRWPINHGSIGINHGSIRPLVFFIDPIDL